MDAVCARLAVIGGCRLAVTGGAVMLTGCKAERFVLESNPGGMNGWCKKCVGLVAACMSDGITKKLRIEAKVSISACGALMTPPLLRNSGLKNRHIGRNIHLHPVPMAWGYFPDGMPEAAAELSGKCYEGGIITTMHRVTACSIIQTPTLGPGCWASLIPWESGRDMKERMLRYARTAHAFALVRYRGAGHMDGEGRVRCAPSREDVEELRNGLRQALRILVAVGATEVGTHRSDGLRLRCDGGLRDEDLEAFLNEVTVGKGPMLPGTDTWALHCSAHQMGSCRMGSSPKDDAVDGRGESWETEGLLFANTQEESYMHMDLILKNYYAVLGWKYIITETKGSLQSLSFICNTEIMQGAEFELDSIKKLSKESAEANELALAGACQFSLLDMCIFFSFYVKLLGDKIDEVVKEWDAQKEGFYERTGLSRGDQLMVIDNDESGVPYHDGSRGNNQLMVIDNDESGVQNHEGDDFDES
ncbi:unnamed protein product [Miscanthus lutarioriparius]|uniref:Uncharacterized protein n=1 Tax=Miscanthus lutarioriparius TaxID=422564 RepID=A0A811S0Q3_9POAL|nr:unnamed protein product [Miscanthus lutarioriparius]